MARAQGIISRSLNTRLRRVLPCFHSHGVGSEARFEIHRHACNAAGLGRIPRQPSGARVALHSSLWGGQCTLDPWIPGSGRLPPSLLAGGSGTSCLFILLGDDDDDHDGGASCVRWDGHVVLYIYGTSRAQRFRLPVNGARGMTRAKGVVGEDGYAGRGSDEGFGGKDAATANG